jgi:hypothetical protein
MSTNRNTRSRMHSDNGGSVTIIMLALLAILLILVLANGRIILNLQRELKLIEKQQVERSSAGRSHSTNTLETSSTLGQLQP